MSENTGVDLETVEIPVPKIVQNKNAKKKRRHAMISYNWADSKAVAHEVYDELCGYGYNVWIDKDQMKGNIYEKMAYAVENAYVILMFLSPNYEKSKNCQREAALIGDIKKWIIPIYVQDDYEPQGMLRILTAGMLYYDFSKGSVKENLQEVINALGPTDEQELMSIEQSSSSSESISRSSSKEENAIKKILQMKKKSNKNDLRLQGIQVSEDDIPLVLPRIVETDLYQGDAFAKLAGGKHDREINFDDLLKLKKRKRFIALVGNPGSGKSVSSKRLAKSDEWPDQICFYLRFAHINYKRELTLQQLLLDKAYPGLNAETYANAFKWIVKNDQNCILIFDGFDQSEWVMNKNPARESYDTPLMVEELVANLCNQTFLSNSFLIFTSRPHSIIALPTELRPDTTYIIKGLPFQGMKKLFYAYAGNNAERIWKNLTATAPDLMNLCLNPLLLQFIVRACLNSAEYAVEKHWSMSRVFKTVLEDLRRSDNTHHNDINTITEQLAKIAYIATRIATVVITEEQLHDVGLDVAAVQDLLIAFNDGKGVNSKIFEGDTKLTFSHQSIQEYFAAVYIKIIMSFSDFIQFVKTNLFTDHWSMVRTFLCGLLVDMESSLVTSEENTLLSRMRLWTGFGNTSLELSDIQKKRKFLVESIVEKLKSASKAEENTGQHLLDLWIDVRECNDDYVLSKATEHFPDIVDFSHILLNANQVSTFCHILSQVSKPISRLNFTGCGLDDFSFHQICLATKRISSIRRFDLQRNRLRFKSLADICDILSKIEAVFTLGPCFFNEEHGGGHRCASEEKEAKIQESLNKSGNWALTVLTNYDLEKNEPIKLKADTEL